MHNLHLQGFCVEGVLIDASTQDTSPFCLLCLNVTFSWLTWLLVYLLGLLGKYYGLHGCAATPAHLSCFPACFSCLIDFYNHVSCCINISWRLLFRDKSSRHVFLISIILVLSWYLSKPMFNKGLWASNFFYLKSEWKPAFFKFGWSSFGLQSFRKLLSFKYELAPFERREFRSTWKPCILSVGAFACLTVFCHNCSWKGICEFLHARRQRLFLVCESHYISACVFTQSCFHHLSKLLSLKTF